MSSFWKGLADFCDARDKATIDRLNRRHATAHKSLTKEMFVNEMHSLEGQIGRWFEQTGSMLVRRIHEVNAKGFGDTISVFAEMLNKQFEQMQQWIDLTFKLYDNSMQSFFKVVMQYLQDMERNNAGRYLTVVNALDLNHNTNVAMYSSICEQIAELKTPHKVYEPSLEWLMDNIGELVKLGIAVEAIRDNNAPASIAKVHAVKSLCAMLPVGMIDAKRALDNAIRSWGVVDLEEAA